MLWRPRGQLIKIGLALEGMSIVVKLDLTALHVVETTRSAYQNRFGPRGYVHCSQTRFDCFACCGNHEVSCVKKGLTLEGVSVFSQTRFDCFACWGNYEVNCIPPPPPKKKRFDPPGCVRYSQNRFDCSVCWGNCEVNCIKIDLTLWVVSVGGMGEGGGGGGGRAWYKGAIYLCRIITAPSPPPTPPHPR